MPLPFNKNLDVKLMRLVKDNPILYNTKLPKYLDFDSREVVWQKIGDTLNRPALKFAAIQCQIQYGDFQEDKHKPGLIENLNEYLPKEFAGSRSLEKKILKLYRQHHGLCQLDAKLLYTKTARDLPTYGVTFFLVKEKQKNKKKLIPRLLGINAESILRLDEVTKEILQVWPLTHVKSYHAGKSDTFTLNFGDYSDSEYCCKTNEVLRIKDILEGYIDIIRKRMARPYGGHHVESAAICHDDVEACSANVITHVSNSPSKIMEHSFVGSSKIIESEEGTPVSQGTQIMTVQQVLITNKGTAQQHAVTGEVRMRSDMSLEFTRKLNGVNSKSVKIVTLLTDPTEDNIKEAQKIVESMEADMPSIIQGVKEASDKQTSPEAKQRLLSELEELCDLVNSLGTASRREDFNPEEVQEPARKIADLSTQIYFALDARTKRRSEFVRRSRQSFIADEKTDATLRRASFLAAAAAAGSTAHDARTSLDKPYTDKPLSSQEIEELEAGVVDKMGKLNAAVALYLIAHSDPDNIDYIQALTSMNTINELIPELTKDAKMLGSARKSEARQELVDDLRALCDAARALCLRSGGDAHGKMQEPASEFAEVSGKLVYVFGYRNKKVNADTENEILELGKQVGDATTVLLMKTNELTSLAPHDPRAARLDRAGVRCADLARDLLACAQLTAPSIHEPHCQSALTSSAENLSSSAQALALAWKPLTDDGRPQLGEDLQAASIELAKALDRLKNSYGLLARGEEVEVDNSPEEAARVQRMKFTFTVVAAQDAMKVAAEELDKPVVNAGLSGQQTKQLERDISQKVAQINAAVASLIHARSDKNNPDYATSEQAIAAISELLPEVIRGTKALSSSCAEPGASGAMLSDVRVWCAGVSAVCAGAASDDVTELDAAAKNFAKASRKLKFVFNPRANKAREQLLMELSMSVRDDAMRLVESSHTMADTLGGASGEQLRAKGDTVGECAWALRTAAELTAPSIEEPRCKSVLVETAEALASSARSLVAHTERVRDDETGCRSLGAKLQQQRGDVLRRGGLLETGIHEIKHACEAADARVEEVEVDNSPEEAARVQRMKFTFTVVAAQDAMKVAAEELDKPVVNAGLSGQQTKQLERDISQKVAQINAAVASLIHARSDKNNPDYATSEQAIATLSELMTEVIRDTKALSSSCAEPGARGAMLGDVRVWCAGVSAVCAGAASDDVTELDAAAKNFAKASRKLKFVFNPRANKAREQLLMELSMSVHGDAMRLVESSHTMADTLGGASGEQLRAKGDTVGECAWALRTAAELTAPSIEEPRCKSVLVETAEALASSARSLVAHTERVRDDETGCRSLGAKLQQQRGDVLRRGALLETSTHKMKQACEGVNDKKPPPPPLPVKTSSLRPKVDECYAVPKELLPTSDRRISQDFIDHLRMEESMNGVPPPATFANRSHSTSTNKTNEAKKQALIKEENTTKSEAEKQAAQAKAKAVLAEEARKETAAREEAKRQATLVKMEAEQLKLKKSVDRAVEKIKKAELDLDKVSTADNSQVQNIMLNDKQADALRQKLERQLASASAATAGLLASNNLLVNALDSSTVCQHIEVLSELMPQIVSDASVLSFGCDDQSQRALLDETRALCEATRSLCASASDDELTQNKMAVVFGDKSARLMYIVSDVDPAQEKEVISRARAIGDSTSRVAQAGVGGPGGAGAGGAGAGGAGVRGAARACAGVAGTLLYTAKLVAPSIQHQECQQALTSACKDLSSDLQTFRNTWTTLDPQSSMFKELTAEADSLEKLLEEFKKDLEGRRLVKRREKIVIEDTPLRQMACIILKDAKKRSELAALPTDKNSFDEYARKLGAAIKDLDVANSRVKQSPQDPKKLDELENAVQKLQYIALQSRPALRNKPESNIIDLTDFVRDVSTEADKFIGDVDKTKVTNGSEALAGIKTECHNINLHAFKLLKPSDQQNRDDSALDGILEVDHFGQDCEKRIRDIDALLNSLEEKHAKESLQEKMMPLAESNNFLRFATKSALSTIKSVGLEETLKDLNDFETMMDQMLVPAEGTFVHKTAPASLATWRVSVAAAASRGTGAALAPALQAYLSELRACTDLTDRRQHDKLKEHMNKLVELLKQLTSRTSARAATWQPTHGPEVNEIMRQILQELGNSEVGCGSDKPKAKIIDDSDMNRLLLPSDDVKIVGTKKELCHKLQQCGTKLSSMSGMVVQSVARAESLRRSAHATADEAARLAAAARALAAAGADPVQKNRVEEACQEMCFATYNLLKTSELVCQENSPGGRRRLLDACRALNDSINRLVRTSSPEKKLESECEELTRSLQLQGLSQSTLPSNSLSYSDSVEVLQGQLEVMHKLESDSPMSREEFSRCLSYVTSAVCNSTEYATQCAYLISISEQNKEEAKQGLVDVPRLQKLTSSAHDVSYRILRTADIDQAKEDETELAAKMKELQQALKESIPRVKDEERRRELSECATRAQGAAEELHVARCDGQVTMDKINKATMGLLDSIGVLNSVLERPGLVPAVGEVSTEVKTMGDDIVTHSKKLLSQTQALIKQVKTSEDDQDPMTWVTFNSHRTGVLKAFDNLLVSLKTNGRRAGLVETATEVEEEPEVLEQSYIQIQVDVAKKWLQKRPLKADVKTAGIEAARNVVDLAQQMSEDMKGQEKEEMLLLISETEDLLKYCSNTYDSEKASGLLEHLVELRKTVERGVVTRLVEDFLEAEAPLEDLDILADAEKDESRRKFLLEKKIAELLAQLGRVRRTARYVADCGARSRGHDLARCGDQTELLAPMLVKAAQERVRSPDDPVVVENYKRVLGQYTESLNKVRDLCDQAVDPMEFVQTAGETMQRMREESAQINEPQRCARTSAAITRLARRVITVSMTSPNARGDASVLAALREAQQRLSAADTSGLRASRLPDWRDTTAEILRTTGEVESVLGGENIFNQQPEPDKPIYNAARSLHAAVREWSARDNEIVAVAKRMAVLMARLSDYMLTDKKRDLIVTSKSVVTESHEVSRFAKKLAHECTDIRIRTNLLQVCERIPTISGQLKMLTTVKGSSLGQQDSQEDKEAMDTLVGNAQNLMSSVQEVLKAAASASVKIASQRGGPKMRWVRRNYY